MGLNTAVVFSGGRLAIWLEKQGMEACHEYALSRVAEAFGNEIRKHVTRIIATAWKTDPWTRGSYSCALPGQAHQRVELARPIEDRLFFAGEATTVGDHACCHGAYRSGIRAAREIAKVL
jgi:monoamine oxidase